ncbi:MAG: DUF2200 domain-containing protein [Clostridiales bacterium]|nr:DUF2200 domain-containing protein [Clostridiales bacterium]
MKTVNSRSVINAENLFISIHPFVAYYFTSIRYGPSRDIARNVRRLDKLVDELAKGKAISIHI